MKKLTLKEGIEVVLNMLEKENVVNWNTELNRALFQEAIFTKYTTKILWAECLKYTKNTAINYKTIFNDKFLKDKKRSPFHIFIFKYFNLRYCTKCYIVYSIDNFYSGKGFCKNCTKQKVKISTNTDKKKEYNKIYYKDNKEDIKEQARNYREKNKSNIQEKRTEHRKAVTKLIYCNWAKKYNLTNFCVNCGYTKNIAALEWHHIDKDLKTYKINQITECSIKEAERRFKYESKNIICLCNNCHDDYHATSKKDRNKGLKDALVFLGYEYKCEKTGYIKNLQLHHNNPKEKECSFSFFGGQTMDNILKKGILKKEMQKNVSILSPNAHAEIEHSEYDRSIILGGE